MNPHSLARALLACTLALLASACATTTTERQCRGPLVPINAPTPTK